MDIPEGRRNAEESVEKIIEGIGASIFLLNVNPLKVEWHNSHDSLLELFSPTLIDLINNAKDLSSLLLDNLDLVELVTGVIARFHLNRKTTISGLHKFISSEEDRWVFYSTSVLQIGQDKNPEKIACVIMQVSDLHNSANTIDDFTNYINYKLYQPSIDSLTDRQKEVLILFGNCKGRKEIAAILNLSIYTIEDHKQALYKKFNCSSTSQLASLAQRIGILK